jgi:hypothetical protein
MSPREKQRAYLWAGVAYWGTMLLVGRYNLLWMGIALMVGSLVYLCFEAYAKTMRRRRAGY